MSSFKPQPGMTTSGNKALRNVETNTADGAPQLRSQVAVLALNRFNQRPRQCNDGKGMFENGGALWIVHAPQGAGFRDNVLPKRDKQSKDVGAKRAPIGRHNPQRGDRRDSAGDGKSKRELVPALPAARRFCDCCRFRNWPTAR